MTAYISCQLYGMKYSFYLKFLTECIFAFKNTRSKTVMQKVYTRHVYFKSSVLLEWQVMCKKTAKHVCGLSSELLQQCKHCLAKSKVAGFSLTVKYVRPDRPHSVPLRAWGGHDCSWLWNWTQEVADTRLTLCSVARLKPFFRSLTVCISTRSSFAILIE